MTTTDTGAPSTPAPAGHPRPQDDLFRAVNGDWLEGARIAPDRSVAGVFVDLRDDAEAAVRTICERAAAGGSAAAEERLVGDLYASFVDEAAVEAAGTAPLADALARVVAVEDVEGFWRLLGQLDREGSGGLVGLSVDTDLGDPDRYLPYLGQGGLGLPDEAYYREEQHAEVLAAYGPHVTAMLRLAGVEEPERHAEAVLALETELAGAHWDRVRRRDVQQMYNLLDRAGLEALAPGLAWDAWLEGLGAPASLLDEVVVAQPSFVEALGGLVVADRLPAWRAWLTWRVVHAAAPYLPAAFVEESFAFYGRRLSGTEQMRERWKRGVALVEGGVGEAVGQVYVREHFPPDAKAQVQLLVDRLVEAYAQEISGLSWMTQETRDRALEKLRLFTPKVGYPDRWKSYDGLEVDRADLLGNVRRVSAHETDRELAKVGRPVDRDEWFMTPQTVNAYFNPGMNEIVFPAAILQPPFFDPAAGDPANYGAIGAVIGHEIGHGFDDQGSRFDGRGQLRDWWTEEDRTAFDALTQRLVAQYDVLEPEQTPGRTVNGALTVGENIGDLGGLGIALVALRLAQAADGRDTTTDDVRAALTSWATAWRSVARPEERLRRLATDPHSPEEFRCNQVARNLDEFHTAFATAPGDGMWMEPADRVRIW
ncbi:M13 family metallopeptidase [uncultured Pseudokineococcus sp.]|uniref:M13 family metallopeptidase n=1 Tax=uncultured Pseudokineococcus sp. TaxID=1642928 RepID=UPI0026118F67|nr:M13-type metalloendopeptidase [uncultured Pseudokineococcus sp.]